MSIYKNQLIEAHNLGVHPSQIPLKPRRSFMGRLRLIFWLGGIR